jgi:hypothetical protein
MKRFSLVPISLILAAVSASAAPNRSTARWPRFRALSRMCAMSTWLVMMGDQFNPNLLSEDRNAIGDVQNAIQKWASYDRVSRFLCRHNCYSHAPSSQRALLGIRCSVSVVCVWYR